MAYYAKIENNHVVGVRNVARGEYQTQIASTNFTKPDELDCYKLSDCIVQNGQLVFSPTAERLEEIEAYRELIEEQRSAEPYEQQIDDAICELYELILELEGGDE